MLNQRTVAAVVFATALAGAGCTRPGRTAAVVDGSEAPEGAWIRPTGESSEPVWGHRDGLSIGLWPTSGPRGLIRIYAPYLGQKRPRMINYISIEPVVNGVRGQSELEVGMQDKQSGLSFWTADTRESATDSREAATIARGRIERIDGVEALTFYLATEPFRNGARPILQVMFRSDRPHEVGFRIHAAPESARMDSCVLSATMGNYARLRRLWLRGEVADARKVWPTFTPDALGFAPWRAWDRERLLKVGGQIVVAATSDEPDPAAATYDPDVPAHWRYTGRPATQYWRTADAPKTVVRVNGRTTYWGNSGRIPGGVSFENFEVESPFAEGQELWFGVSPDGPKVLGFDPAWGKVITGGE
jgi:hypothetical protein